MVFLRLGINDNNKILMRTEALAKTDFLTVLLMVFSLGVFFTAMAPVVMAPTESVQLQSVVFKESIALSP